MKKTIMILLCFGLMGGTFNIASAVDPAYFSGNPAHLEPLKNTQWAFAFKIVSNTFIDTITFGSTVTMTSGVAIMDCYDESGRSGYVAYGGLVTGGIGFKVLFRDESFDQNYHFIITSDTANGVYYLGNRMTGEFSEYFSMSGVKRMGSILNTYYRDFDNDDYGDPKSPFEAPSCPDGYVTNNLDCNDYDASIHPGATEIRGDGIDQDCDGRDLPIIYDNSLTQTQVSQLYVSIFGRASEGEGNTYWQTNQNDMSVAADTMLDTEAAQIYFGATLNDDQAFIEFIYENTLGKTYGDDPEGVDYWVWELSTGKSKGQVVSTLINAAMNPQYTGLPAQNQFINKVTVCNYTAETVYTCPNVNDLSAFVKVISDVTNDLATVTTAKAVIDSL